MKNDFALRVLIVEDDFSFALDLQMLLEKLGYIPMSIVESGEKALQYIRRTPPDAILMDIDLKGNLTGLDLAGEIKSLEIPVLFITSHQDKAEYERAQRIGMIGFLVKPLSDLTLLSAIEACFRNIESPDTTKELLGDKGTRRLNDSLLIKKGKIYYKVRIDEIVFVSSDLEYATIHTEKENFTFRESLKNLVLLLGHTQFYRVHQSHVININFLKAIDTVDNKAVMSEQSRVPISRRRRKELEERWHSYG